MEEIKKLQSILLHSGDPRAGLIINPSQVSMICNNEVYITIDEIIKALKKIEDQYVCT